MEDLNNLICQQQGCPLSTSGTCLEGLDDPHDCPHVKERSKTPQPPAEDEEASDESAALTSDWKPVGGGYELTVDEASEVTAEHEAKVIVLAGEPDAGKTTLLATIYELFSKGDVPEYSFAGTQTILAFERACFPSRTASGNQKPVTDRTRHTRPRFYHLSLREAGETRNRKHLLMGDISGEVFQRASDNQAETEKLSYLKRADVFVLILDGDKIQSRTERQEVAQRASLIFRALLKAGMLTKESRVQVLVSKFDCFDPADANSTEFLAYLKQDLESRYANQFKSYVVSEIASRPANDRVDFAYGVRELLMPWLSDRELAWDSALPSRPDNLVMREADEYLWRHTGGLGNG
jgi:Double-GTPase 2